MNLLNNLTIKHLKMNKKRTLVTIIGVLLSTALMVGIGLLFASFRDYLIKEIKINYGSHHLKIVELNKEQFSLLQNNSKLSHLQYESKIGNALLEGSQNKYKPYLYINGVNQVFLNNLKLLEGRLPVNDKEVVISEHIETNSLVKYNVGDILTLEVGDRYYEGQPLLSNGPYLKEDESNQREEFKRESTEKYTIVGIVQRHYSESYEAAGYSLFTLKETISENSLVNVYLNFKSLKNFYQEVNYLAEKLELEKISFDENGYYPNLIYNNTLLELYGVSNHDNVNTSIMKVIVIILSVLSVGCITVIYNSFAISVMERKKQLGLLSSVGTSKKQLRKTVFFEALIIGLIGIPLGLLSSFIGIGIVLKIINALLSHLFVVKLSLSFYLGFIIIPILFMVIVIFLSAFFPARKASKISPIEAIRLSDDIKIKSKKLKTPQIVNKLFGIEGEIAYKNIKRNKRKYRITIISLFISIVMFISFSSLMQYGTLGSETYLNLVDYDINVSFSTSNERAYLNLIKQLQTQENVTSLLAFERMSINIPKIPFEEYHENYQKVINMLKKNNKSPYDFDYPYDFVALLKVDKNSYQHYQKELKLKEKHPLLINYFETSVIDKKKERIIKGTYLKKVKSLELNLYDLSTTEEETDYQKIYKLDNLVEITIPPFGLKEEVYNFPTLIILPPQVYDDIVSKREEGFDQDLNLEKQIRMKTTNHQKLIKILNTIKKNPEFQNFYIFDVVSQTKTQRNLFIIVKLLFYGFISLVTLIGVTSVFNTINTSMALRRKEFAVFRSVGLNRSGFNKMLRLETIMVGFKSLLYGLPVSLAITSLLHFAVSDVVAFSKIIMPWKAIIIAIMGDFLIVAMTMIYATKQIKKDNIIDTIRIENI